MIDAGRCAHVVVRRDGGGRCVAELQQLDPGQVRGACAYVGTIASIQRSYHTRCPNKQRNLPWTCQTRNAQVELLPPAACRLLTHQTNARRASPSCAPEDPLYCLCCSASAEQQQLSESAAAGQPVRERAHDALASTTIAWLVEILTHQTNAWQASP